MSYSKQTWVDRAVEFFRRFAVTESDGKLTLTEEPGVVTEAGTPLDASRLNHMEDGIESAHDDLATHKADNYFYRQTIYYTSGGTFTKASYPWLKAVRVKLVGGGGAGGGVPACGSGESAGGGGGGGGGYSEKFILGSVLASSVSITVGAAGIGSSGAAGGNGGNSAFGTHATANGGVGGTAGTVRTASIIEQDAEGGTSASGDINIKGRNGFPAYVVNAGAAGGATSGRGADGILGTGGDNRRPGAAGLLAGTNATGYGAGGSGAGARGVSLAGAGGNGAPGIVIVELYG